MKPNLSGKSLFIFDLDGVFYRGKEDRVKIGGTRAVEHLRRLGKQLLVLTNDSTDTTDTIHRRLADFKIPFERDEILSSAMLTADYLRMKHGKVSYFLIGEKGLEEEMRKFGHRRVQGEGAKFVVVGLDRELTYDKLDRAAMLVRNGASMVATHSSRLYMYKKGPAIAPGPIVKALEYATRKRAVVIGKPSPVMFKIALERAHCSAKQAVMVGDQVETDIIGAKRAGIDAILVTTGLDKDSANVEGVPTISNVDELVTLV